MPTGQKMVGEEKSSIYALWIWDELNNLRGAYYDVSFRGSQNKAKKQGWQEMKMVMLELWKTEYETGSTSF